VSGTLEPDAAGTYERIADINGLPAFKRLDGAYYIWHDWGDDRYHLANVTDWYTADPMWVHTEASTTPQGEYVPEINGTGNATVT